MSQNFSGSLTIININIMKKFIFFFFALFSLFAFSQQTDFNYQAIIKGSNGMAVSGQSVVMQFSIIYDAANGTVAYQETHTVNTSVDGLVNLVIGSGTPTSQTGDSWGAIDWGRPLFLKEEVNLGGGFTSLGTGRIYSVPIANYAAKAGAITGVMTGNVSASTVTATNINSGSISASGITAGTITATLFSGDGSGLTNVPILTFRNAENSFYLGQSPSNVVSGDALDNLSIGHQTLQFITTGDRNTAIGFNVLQRNTTGNDNIAIGARSQEGLGSGTSGGASRNNSLGVMTLMANTTGDENTAIGHHSVYSNTTGSKNTGFGYRSLYTNTTGANNTAIGHTADVAANNLVNATAIGYGAVVGASNSIQLGNSNVNLIKTSGVVSATGIITSGRVTATAFSGDGSGLTNLPASSSVATSTAMPNEILIHPHMVATNASVSYPPGYSINLIPFPEGTGTVMGGVLIPIMMPSNWNKGNVVVTFYYSCSAADGDIYFKTGARRYGTGDQNITYPVAGFDLTPAAAWTLYKHSYTQSVGDYNANSTDDTILILNFSRYGYQPQTYGDTNTGNMYIHGIRVAFSTN